MPIVKCKLCINKFYAKPSWIKKGWGKYCSKNCQYESNKNGKTVQCFICQKQTYKSSKELRVSKSKKYFCGKSCQTIWRNSVVFVGSRHRNWRDGEHAYRNILLRSGVARTCKRCSMSDVRLLAVHHLDKNRKNNNVRNLIWLCPNCHFLIHHYENEKRIFMETLV